MNYLVQPKVKFLVDNGWSRILNRKLITWIKNSNPGSNDPNLTLSIDIKKFVHLTANLSIPKFIFGNNISLPNQSQLSAALDKISSYVEMHSGYEFDAHTASVRRIDYTRNYQVGKQNVVPMISELSQKNLVCHDRLKYNDTTVYYKGKGKNHEIKIYSKLHETCKKPTSPELVEAARGVLRIECSYSAISSINALVKRLSLRGRTVNQLLTEEVSDFVLSQAEESLNFKPFLVKAECQLTTLMNYYGIARAMRLNGFLNFVKNFGEGFYKDPQFGFSKDSYNRDARDCRNADVWVNQQE